MKSRTIFAVWRVYDENNNEPTKFLVINLHTKNVHAVCTNITAAEHICNDLNKNSTLVRIK